MKSMIAKNGTHIASRDFCSCGQDTCVCQVCGSIVCCSLATCMAVPGRSFNGKTKDEKGKAYTVCYNWEDVWPQICDLPPGRDAEAIIRWSLFNQAHEYVIKARSFELNKNAA